MIILLLLLVIILILFICKLSKDIRLTRDENNELNIELTKRKEALKKEYMSEMEATAAARLNALNASYEIQKDRLNNQIVVAKTHYSDLLELQEKQAKSFEETKKNYTSIMEDNIAQAIVDQVVAFQDGAQSYRDEQQLLIDKYKEQIDEVKNELDDFKAKRDAINQQILQERALAEQQDFYRIVITNEAKADIDILNSIRPRLSNRISLDKMIYDNYIAKPMKEMSKRVLNGEDPSGIYKITNIETNEIYIGKSVHIATRWSDHIKSACGLEGVADSQFQRALKKYGVDKWTFQLLEKVPKENLTEREKYFIMIYESNKYGYNMKIG